MSDQKLHIVECSAICFFLEVILYKDGLIVIYITISDIVDKAGQTILYRSLQYSASVTSCYLNVVGTWLV